MRQFFEVQKTNKKIFMETLFWKSKREAFEIEQGYEGFSEKWVYVFALYSLIISYNNRESRLTVELFSTEFPGI